MTTRNYAAELNVATDLALKAGALLRAEFHRAGGPRSDGLSHATVDEEAERLIARGLNTAYPEDSFLGEETRGRGSLDAPRTWYVDPHDGTRAFIRGHRGSAVSIGLVVDGLPRLGVVYAPTAPDDGGDLITWAEGEPLRRNGVVVERAPLHATLHGLSVVALNADATGKHLSNSLALVEPARLLARCSIAYRLALVAVGEADAAISLSGPGNYDVAGGHALLRAVAGELVDARGQPFRYGSRGTGNTNVFGGHPDVARHLAERAERTRSLSLPRSRLDQSHPHVAPAHAQKVSDAAVLARAHGALLGQVAGDALGQLVEFRSKTEIFRAWPGGVRDLVDGGTWGTLAGQPTDDSELALILARTIAAKGGFDIDVVQEAYKGWLDSRPFDVGTTTRRGILGQSTADSESNGSAMRISPLAVHMWRNAPDAVAAIAAQDAQLTHESAACVEATAVLAVAIATAVREGLIPRALYDVVARWVRGNELFESGVKELFLRDDVEPVKDFQRNQGWVLIALRNAFHQLLHAPSFEEGVVRTVAQGGDTDTNGAIVGALLGAVYGRDAVPLRWRRTVLTCRAHHGTHPRPMPFWADDLLELAERLVALGRLHEVVPEEDRSVVSLQQVRDHRAGEGDARLALRRAAAAAVPELKRAAMGLALFTGVPVIADNDKNDGTDEQASPHKVSSVTRALLRATDAQVVAMARALELLEEIGGSDENGGGSVREDGSDEQ